MFRLRYRAVLGAFVFLLLAGTEHVLADVVLSDESQKPVSPKEVELPESSPSSPPLATDDPGTPGPMGVEVNFISNVDLHKDGHSTSGGLDANFGLGERIQLRVEKEAHTEVATSEADFNGFGSTDVGVKWRFYDDKSLKLAIYPSYDFSDETQKEGVEPEGRSIFLPLIISKSVSSYTFLINAGLTKNLDYTAKKADFISLAIGHALGETFRVMTEIASQRSDDDRRTDVRIGVVKEIFPNEQSKFESGLFASVGESVGATEDGQAHTTILFGLSVAKKPN